MHISRRYDADQISPKCKCYEQLSIRVGLTQCEKSRLLCRMALVVLHHKREVEEHLFALPRHHPVLIPVLSDVVLVPFEPLRSKSVCGGHGSLDVYDTSIHQIFCCFHFPRRKNSMATTASVDSEIAIARNTPFGPMPVLMASVYASGIWSSQ